MGLFSFLKKDKKSEPPQTKPILGMVLLEDPASLNIEGVINELKTKWKLEVPSPEEDEGPSVIDINGYTVAIAAMPVPIPGDEVKKATEYNYFWENGVEEAAAHKGHVILSIMNAGENPAKENLLYSKVASAVLNNSKSIGIYIGGRTLAISKDFYQSNVETMSEGELPLYLWVYFGLRQEEDKQSIYTYGLADFGKKEMEILNSQRPLSELNDIMYNMVHYVIAHNVTLKHGETIGMSAEQKLKISESNGKFLEGKTLKIDF